MRRKLKWEWLLVALAFAGCVTNTAGISVSSKAAKNVLKPNIAPPIIVGNWAVADAVKVEQLTSAVEGGFLKASAVVSSRKSRTLKMQYKFTWYSTDGVAVDPYATNWEPLVLYGKETKTIQAVAPQSTVTEFNIQIRFVKE